MNDIALQLFSLTTLHELFFTLVMYPKIFHLIIALVVLVGFIFMELNSQQRPFSIKLWPPSENTRQTLVERMTNNLTTKSLFTQKYGTLDMEEAEENAKRIEDMAFATANLHYEKEPNGDGGSAVQLYAKECSKLLLDVLKRGPSKKDNEVVTSIGDEKEAEYFCVMAREEEKKKLLQMYAKTSIIMMRKKMKIF